MRIIRAINDIRTGKSAILSDPFRGERQVADGPVEIKPVPEHPRWLVQPEPGYDADWWIYRSSPANSKTVTIVVVALLALAFAGMALID